MGLSLKQKVLNTCARIQTVSKRDTGFEYGSFNIFNKIE